MSKRIIPINRINKFFSNEDFNLEISMGRESLEGDGNFMVILYRVDRGGTSSDDIYNESEPNDIAFFAPIELRVVPTLGIAVNKTYNDNGSLRYLEDGQLSFGIYDAQLAELDVELSYGDYIGYPVTESEVRYFTIVNDGVKNYDNAHTIMGYKAAFRTVICAPTDNNEFNSM